VAVLFADSVILLSIADLTVFRTLLISAGAVAAGMPGNVTLCNSVINTLGSYMWYVEEWLEH